MRILLSRCAALFAGILAMWTRGWAGLAMENWNQGGGPLTLVQIVRSGAACRLFIYCQGRSLDARASVSWLGDMLFE